MRILFIAFAVLLTACGQDKIQTKTVENNTVKAPELIPDGGKYKYTGNQKGFKPIPYSLSYDYADTIAKKLVPNADWQYWAYVRYMGYNNVFTIIAEKGDLKYRKYTRKLPKNDGFFHGCHPNFCSNFAVVIKNDSVRYIATAEMFRDFIGKVDNLEEAMLLAKTHGYILGDSIISARYRIANGNYEMNLLKAGDFRIEEKLEATEVIVTPSAYIKTRNLGIYCEGRGCY